MYQQQLESINRSYPPEDEHNQQIVLEALSIFTPITSSLLKLEQLLYPNAETLPRPIFKQFRKLRDDIQTLFSLVSSYASPNPSFNQRKDGFLQEQIQAMEAEISRSQTNKSRAIQSRSRPLDKKKVSNLELDQSDKRIELLSKEIQSLKNELRRNDSEYQIEIKKYNIKYQQMQEEIDYYRRESEKLQEYTDVIDRLEVELRVLRESKERDEQLIQNMAWKLRNLERQRYGRTAFLSPHASKSNFINSSSRVQTNYSPKTHLHSQFE